MAAFGFDLPNINGNTLKDEKERKQIMDYLFQLTEQLKYTLSHLDQDNMTETFRAEIQSTEAIKSFERKLESADGQLQAVLKQTAEGFKLYVKKDDVISSINQSGEMIAIDASKLKLEGYVTINGSFTVDEEGYLRCTGGTLGAFTVTSTGAIMGNGSMMIGNMTFEGNSVLGLERAKSLLITPDNIDFDKSTEFAEGESYMLGIVPGGWPNYTTDFAVGVPYVDIGGSRYYIGLDPIGGSGSGTSTTKVSAIRILADNLHKRASNSASSDSLGYAQSGELYQGSITGNWAYCTHELVFTSGGYTRIPLEQSFYCATQSSSGKKYVEQITVQLA